MMCIVCPSLQQGDVVKLPEYAALLKRIANDGIGDFYEGDIANDTIQTVSRASHVIFKYMYHTYELIGLLLHYCLHFKVIKIYFHSRCVVKNLRCDRSQLPLKYA